MPTITRNQDSQNGRDRSDQSLFPQVLDFNQTQTQSPALPSEDWSFLTKELINTLPRVWTRGLLYLLLVFAAIILPWVMLSKVDETSSARGRLEPKGKTLKLDTPVAGKVTAIKVKEGQAIRKGQILLELESELTQTQLQQAQAKIEGQLNRVTQLQVLKNQIEISLRTQQQQSLAQRAAQQAQIEQTQQRFSFNRNAYNLAKSRLATDTTEVERYSRLAKKEVVPQVKLVEVKRSKDETQQMLNQAASEMQQTSYEIKKQRNDYKNVIRAGELIMLESSQRIQQIQAQIVDMQSEITQTQKQIKFLKFQLGQRVVRATTNGTIFQLSADNAGSVLQSGQTITQIAPQGATLILKAQMPTSSERGSLRVGMPVKLKFDAYPFQDYGVVAGRLSWISPDSKAVETSQGKLEVFELEVTLNQTYIQTQNKRIALKPGQTATAEVIVRERRLIDFILDPFKKLQKGGLEL